MRYTHTTLLRLLFAIAAVVLLGFVLSMVSLSDVWDALRRLTLAELAVLAGVNGAILVTLSARWWIFLHAQGFTLPYWALVRYRLTASSASATSRPVPLRRGTLPGLRSLRPGIASL